MNENKRKTGRTTRMFKHAIESACAGNTVLIVSNDYGHAKTLPMQIESLAKASGIPKLKRTRGMNVLRKRLIVTTFDSLKGFDWATGTLPMGSKNREFVVDHYALESRLARVHDYLKATEDLLFEKEVREWMATTAKAMSAMGRAVYLVSDSQYMRDELALLVPYRNGSIEEPSKFGYDFRTMQHPKNMHLNCLVIPDPLMIRRMFVGSLDLINRWDK